MQFDTRYLPFHCVQMDVIKGYETFKREFPLLAAVDRCSNGERRAEKRKRNPSKAVTSVACSEGQSVIVNS